MSKQPLISIPVSDMSSASESFQWPSEEMYKTLMPKDLRVTWVGLDYILRSIKHQSELTVEELMSKDFLVDKSRIRADIGAVRKRNGDEFEGIR